MSDPVLVTLRVTMWKFVRTHAGNNTRGNATTRTARNWSTTTNRLSWVRPAPFSDFSTPSADRWAPLMSGTAGTDPRRTSRSAFGQICTVGSVSVRK